MPKWRSSATSEICSKPAIRRSRGNYWTGDRHMNLLADLGWLRRPPGDLRDRCRSLRGSVGEPDLAFDTALVDIASYGLDINQLTWVSRLVADRLKSPVDTVLARFKL